MRLRVKEICKSQGKTLKELAGALGITEVALRKSLAGNPTIATLERIASALNIAIVDLFNIPAPCTHETCSAIDTLQQTTIISCPHCGKPIKFVLTE